MRRGLKLMPLVTAVAEIVVFVLVGRWVGFGWTVLLVLAASLLGMILLRREGIRAWRGFRAAAAAGRPPGEQVTDGVIGLAAGGLLAVPGLVTGVLGLLLVLPPVRRAGRGWVQHAAERRVSAAVAGDLFGPRRVRVRRGEPFDGDRHPQAGPVPFPQQEPAIEGEIVEPGQHR